MVDEYIASFSEPVQNRLMRIRQLVMENAPGCEERISYGMAAYFTHQKPLIYFGGFEKHIGLYATPSGHVAFKDKLAGYKQGKGSVQFPHSAPLPELLIAELVRYRVEENQKRYGAK